MTHYSIEFFWQRVKNDQNKHARNIWYANLTQKSIKDLNFKLTVGRSSSRVSRHGHSETESELMELIIYISMADYSLADSVNFCLFPELFLFPVLPIIPEIIREQ